MSTYPAQKKGCLASGSTFFAEALAADCLMRGSRSKSGCSAVTRSTARCQLSAARGPVALASSPEAVATSRRNSSTKSTATLPPIRHRLTIALRPPAASRSVVARKRSSPGCAGSFERPPAIAVCMPGSTTHCGRLCGVATHSPNVAPPLALLPPMSGRAAMGPSPKSSSNTTSVSHSPPIRQEGTPDTCVGRTHTCSSDADKRVTISCAASGLSLRKNLPAWIPIGPLAREGS